MIDAYKNNNENKNIISRNELQKHNPTDSVDPLTLLVSENIKPDSVIINLIPSLQAFQNAFMNESFKDTCKIAENITNAVMLYQPDELSFEYIINSNVIDQICYLLTNATSYEIYQSMIWLILHIFKVSAKFQEIEIIKAFESFNLFHFLLFQFNPCYTKDLLEDSNSKMKINLDNTDMKLLPYYLRLFSYYIFFFDQKYREIILKLIIIPNLEIYFDDFDRGDIIIEASFLIYGSTKFLLHDEYKGYINWVITFIIQNWNKLDNQSQYFLLKSVLNLSSSKIYIETLFLFHFSEFLEKNLNIKNTNDEIMKTSLLLQNKFLQTYPDKVHIDYKKLLEIGTSNNSESKLVAFSLFRTALNLKKNDSPLSDNQFFDYFMDKFINGSFGIKSEFINIIGTWLLNSSQKIILQRAPAIVSVITPVLLEVSVSDQLNLLILQELKIFFDHASRNQVEFRNLKKIFEKVDGIDILKEIPLETESPDENSELAMIILSYWSKIN